MAALEPLKAPRVTRCNNPACPTTATATGVPAGWLSLMQAHPQAHADRRTPLVGLGWYCSVGCLGAALEAMGDTQ